MTDSLYFMAASCPSMTRSLRFNVKFLSDPPTPAHPSPPQPPITSRLAAAPPSCWMHVIIYKQQPRQDTEIKNENGHSTATHAYSDTQPDALARAPTHTQICWIGSVLSALAASTCVPPSERTSQFPSKPKALICHPVQSKFNASNYRGSASRQIWSGEPWQESLLRIRAF